MDAYNFKRVVSQSFLTFGWLQSVQNRVCIFFIVESLFANLESYLDIVFFYANNMFTWKCGFNGLNPILKTILAFGWLEVLSNGLYLYYF